MSEYTYVFIVIMIIIIIIIRTGFEDYDSPQTRVLGDVHLKVGEARDYLVQGRHVLVDFRIAVSCNGVDSSLTTITWVLGDSVHCYK